MGHRAGTHRDQESAKGVEGATLKGRGGNVLSGLPMWVRKRPQVESALRLAHCVKRWQASRTLWKTQKGDTVFSFADVTVSSGAFLSSRSLPAVFSLALNTLPSHVCAPAGLCPDPGLPPECRMLESFPRISPLLVFEVLTICGCLISLGEQLTVPVVGPKKGLNA